MNVTVIAQLPRLGTNATHTLPLLLYYSIFEYEWTLTYSYCVTASFSRTDQTHHFALHHLFHQLGTYATHTLPFLRYTYSSISLSFRFDFPCTHQSCSNWFFVCTIERLKRSKFTKRTTKFRKRAI